MKELISILFVFLVGCAITPTIKRVVGSYEAKIEGLNPLLPKHFFTIRKVFLENGNYEAFNNGKKILVGKCKIVGKEVHVDYGTSVFYRIETNGDLTAIAENNDGKREAFTKEYQQTYQKLKDGGGKEN